MTNDLPTGTVTFLFTDIEGSTELWERFPESMSGALARHDGIVRDTIVAHGGHVFKEVGDGIYGAFASAPRAVAAALAVQRALQLEEWVTNEPLRVRVALHAGEARPREGDYYGRVLNRTARILAAGHGGQILLSQAVERLTSASFPEGVALRDLGERSLKDLTDPERLFQLVADDLPTEFPPLRTLDVRPHNIPAQTSPLIGREEEIREIRELVLDPSIRLVTLLGPGGTGKTRLALHVAAEQIDAFPDGVFIVNLAPIREPALLPETILEVWGLRPEEEEPAMRTLTSYLEEQELLLILDNFEQIVDGAPMVDQLLRSAPGLTVLVTSQASLRLRAEQEYPVPPLRLPDVGEDRNVESLQANEAVALFEERARAIQPAFRVTADNAAVVASLVRQLDGLPLAIELAAARIKLFPPEAIERRLQRQFDFLTSRSRDLPPRQRTLRSAIEWSYDLLEEEEKILFRRQAVFDGGYTFEAAEAVCSPEDEAIDVLGGLESLVDKSLLRAVVTEDGEPRFERLRTIRAFALEKLEEGGDAERWHRRHAEHFAELAEEVDPSRGSDPDVDGRLARFSLELENLRAAFEWAMSRREASLAVRLCRALPAVWFTRGLLEDGKRWLERVLALGDDLTELDRAHALNLFGRLAQIQGDNSPAVIAKFEESLERFRSAGDRAGEARALMNIGNARNRLGQGRRARELFDEALEIYREIDDPFGTGGALMNLGDSWRAEGDDERALDYFERARDTARVSGNRIGLGYALGYVGAVHHHRGDLEEARRAYEESEELFRELGSLPGLMWAVCYRAMLARDLGERERARELFGEGMEAARRLDYPPALAAVLLGFATLELDAERVEEAVRLLGVTRELREDVRVSVSPLEMEWAERIEEVGRRELGEGRYREALGEGRALSIEEAALLATRGRPARVF